MPCKQCLHLGACRKLRTRLVSDAELSNPEFVRDVRAFAYLQDVSSDLWLEHLSDLYRDFRGVIVNSAGVEIFLNMEEFERPTIRIWFRDFCCTPCAPHIRPYVRGEAWERARILATILRARFPEKAEFWGLRGHAVNDNRPPK